MSKGGWNAVTSMNKAVPPEFYRSMSWVVFRRHFEPEERLRMTRHSAGRGRRHSAQGTEILFRSSRAVTGTTN